MPKLEKFFIQIIKGERQGILATILRLLLILFSYGFRFAVWMRNLAFDRGWLHQHRASIPVISIGNITVGGTGKTPVTLLLAQELSKKFRVAILSRGYRSPAEKCSHPMILSRGQGPEYPASICGDEPYLLSRKVPEAIVIVGKDRRRASQLAAEAGAELILLDDGMQHRYLARDHEVVVLNGRDPFGQDRFFPAGFLREGVSALKRADLIFINHADNEKMVKEIENRIRSYTDASLVCTQLQTLGAPSLEGLRVGIFCGIADPRSFRKSVETLGVEIVAERFYRDHESFAEENLQQFAQECKSKGAEMLLCTEKDDVKITSHWKLALPIVWIGVELKIVAGEKVWDLFLKKINGKK